MPEPRYSYIRIGLPLPVDVFATLGNLIDKAWPGADIITDPEKAGVPREFWPGWRGGEQLIRIDTTRKPKAVSKKAAQETAAENYVEDDEERLTTGGIDEDGWVKMSAPEDLQMHLGLVAHTILEGTQGALNYLEWQMSDPDGNTTVLSVARSKGQTPHQLRMKAEAERDELREAVRELLAMYPGGCDGLGCGGWDDVVPRLRALVPAGEDQVEAPR